MENKRRSSSDGGFHLRSVSPSAAQDEGGRAQGGSVVTAQAHLQGRGNKGRT